MRTTRKFTVRGGETELNLSMSPYYSGYNNGPDITVRMCGSESVDTGNGQAFKAYDGKIEMSIPEAIQLISQLNGAIIDFYRKAKAEATQ